MEAKQAIAALGALAQETRLAVYRLLVSAGPTGCRPGRSRKRWGWRRPR